MMWLTACTQVGFSLTPWRLKLYGLPQLVVFISYRRLHYVVICRFNRDLGILLDANVSVKSRERYEPASLYCGSCDLSVVQCRTPVIDCVTCPQSSGLRYIRSYVSCNGSGRDELRRTTHLWSFSHITPLFQQLRCMVNGKGTDWLQDRCAFNCKKYCKIISALKSTSKCGSEAHGLNC